MKTEVRICFDSNEIPGGARTALALAGCGPDVAKIDDQPVLDRIDAWVTLEETDPHLPVLLNLLRQQNASWLEFTMATRGVGERTVAGHAADARGGGQWRREMGND